MTPHDLARRWLADPASTPEQRAHAAWRLTLPDTPPPPTDPIADRVLRCPHGSPGASCCGGWSCRLDPDELRAVTLADCSACPSLPPP